MSIRVLNADDHPILRKGIVDLIVESEGLEWVGSASDGKEALQKIQDIKPDIALLDIEMPHLTGIEIARELKQKASETKVILLTLFKDSSFVKNALAEGVMGYLLKESKESEILDCIKSVSEGKPYISPSLTNVLITINSGNNSPLESLTEHEINILRLIAKNKTSKEIAEMLFLSPKTISNHRNNISKKLGLEGQQNALLKWVLENKDQLA